MQKKTIYSILLIQIVLSLMVVADWRRSFEGNSLFLMRDNSHQAGAEYDTIAQSIRDGRGFSDPFQEPSGPTAWMPPILPLVLATLYAMLGDNRDSVVNLFIAFQGIAACVAGIVALRLANNGGRFLLTLICLALAMMADFYELFQRTHDTQLIVVCLSVLLVGIVKLWERPNSIPVELSWGVFGGVLALCSPVLGGTWAALTCIRWFPVGAERASVRFRPLFLTALVSMLVVSPWVVRNYVQFGKFIPVKSNLAYEVWQSQVLDDDGVLDRASAFRHPWGSRRSQRLEYLHEGEVEFLHKRWQPVYDSIRTDPMDFPRRAANRAVAATLSYHSFAPSDKHFVWPMRYKRVVFPLAFLSLCVILIFGKRPFSPVLSASILIYLLFLGPYVLISYYDRYAAPLFAIKAILIAHGTATLCDVLCRAFARTSTPART